MNSMTMVNISSSKQSLRGGTQNDHDPKGRRQYRYRISVWIEYQAFVTSDWQGNLAAAVSYLMMSFILPDSDLYAAAVALRST